MTTTIDELEQQYDTEKLIENVWSTDKYINLFKEVLDMIVYETHHLSEGALRYDRLLFHKQSSMVFSEDKSVERKKHEEEIRTLATLMTQKVNDGEFFMSGFSVKEEDD